MTHSTVIRPSEAHVAALLAPYRAARAQKRRLWLTGAVVLALLLLLAGRVAEIAPSTLWSRIENFGGYFVRIAHLEDGRFVLADPVEWFWGLRKWSGELLDTLLIAYLGTFPGAIGAFFLCFSASGNLTPEKGWRFAARRTLEFCRSVPEIVFALIFVVAFGLGPVPGVLALSIHTMGALGKLFSEVVENIDMKPVEGAVASGASRWQAILFAVAPQVAASFASYALIRFEINVRGATVMGFVGAGGIGQTLMESIRKFYYSDVSALLVIIIVTVMLIDMLSERIRHTIIGEGTGK